MVLYKVMKQDIQVMITLWTKFEVCPSMNLKYSYNIKSGVATDLNVNETESATNTETHEEKANIPQVDPMSHD
jgi:hypothetical protein